MEGKESVLAGALGYEMALVWALGLEQEQEPRVLGLVPGLALELELEQAPGRVPGWVQLVGSLLFSERGEPTSLTASLLEQNSQRRQRALEGPKHCFRQALALGEGAVWIS